MTPARPWNIFVCHASGHPTDVLPHGDGLLALSFVRHLADRGHTVHVAVDQSTISQPLPPNVVLHQLNPQPTAGELSPIAHMVRVRRLFKRLRRQVPFDLIHQLNPAFTGISLAMYGTGVPCVIGPYAGNWLEEERRSPMQLVREAVRMKIRYLQQTHATAILAWNRTALVNVERTGAMRAAGMKDKLFIVPPGIDTDAFSPCAEVERESPVILFLANLVRRKGIFTLLDAFDTVAAENPTCRLHVAGDGPELGEVKQRASESPYRDRIRFLGKVERSMIPAVMRGCDVYCLPSYGEPFGMTALEAMSCGKPVVATDAGGLAELVSGEGGRKARVRDPFSLARELLYVLGSANLRKAMGEANRRIVVARYSWPRVIDQLEEVYQAVTGGGTDRAVRTNGVLPSQAA